MRNCIFSILALSLFLSCVGRGGKSQTLSREDSTMIVKMYTYVDTLNGYWKLNISQDKAAELGISEKVYSLFVENMRAVNEHIDSIKKRDSAAVIGYHFPK